MTSTRPVPTFFSLFFYHSIFCVFTFLITQLLTPRLRCDRPVFDLDKRRAYRNSVPAPGNERPNLGRECRVWFFREMQNSLHAERCARLPPGMGAVHRFVSPQAYNCAAPSIYMAPSAHGTLLFVYGVYLKLR